MFFYRGGDPAAIIAAVVGFKITRRFPYKNMIISVAEFINISISVYCFISRYNSPCNLYIFDTFARCAFFAYLLTALCRSSSLFANIICFMCCASFLTSSAVRGIIGMWAGLLPPRGFLFGFGFVAVYNIFGGFFGVLDDLGGGSASVCLTHNHF